MNRENIIRMANESNLLGIYADEAIDSVIRFAALIASAERSACAKICEEHSTWTGRMCAETIKARG